MKKQFILVLLLALAAGPVMAQSSNMSDDQVMSFVVKEHERGTSNPQIVTKLMQKGVDACVPTMARLVKTTAVESARNLRTIATIVYRQRKTPIIVIPTITTMRNTWISRMS